MPKPLIIVYLIVLHLAAGLFVYQIVFEREGSERATPGAASPQQPSASPSVPSYYETSRTVLARMDKLVPEGAVVFLGDSLTESLPVSAVVAPETAAANFGVAGDSVGGLLRRTADYQSLRKARAIIVMIGTNDAAFEFGDELMAADLKNMSDFLPAAPPIFWYAVPPVDSRIEKQITPARIRRINAGIRDACAWKANCHFVDLTEILADETGNLKPENHIGDGYHFSERGYRIWIDDLKVRLATAAAR